MNANKEVRRRNDGRSKSKCRLTAYVNPELARRIRHAAVDDGVKLSNLIEELLTAGMRLHRKRGSDDAAE